MNNSQINVEDTYTLFTDGGSRGNPGPAASAWIISEQNGEKIFSDSLYLGSATNNFAEYTALINGLKSATSLGIKHIKCFTDSELMAKQINGVYKVKDANIKVLFDQISGLKGSFETFSVTHVLREKNKEADKLVNRCLDAH